MTQTSHLTSGPITNLDGTNGVITANAAGEGAAGELEEIFGFCVPVAADAALSTYRFVRIPTNAKLKSVRLVNEAQGAGKIQLGLYYSDSVYDGTLIANQGLVVSDQSSVSQVNLFAGDQDLTSAFILKEVLGDSTNTATLWTQDKMNMPLWKAANLVSDPGGFFDIVGTVHTTAVTTGTGRVGVSAEFVAE